MSLFTSYTPTLNPTPSQQARSSVPSTTEKEDTKGKLTEKDLFELISKVDGLPNDTKVLVNSLSNMFLMSELTGVSDLASTYLSNLYQLKVASYNKKEYDKAYTEVTKNGGLNEYAITASGQVVVIDEDDNIKQIGVLELLNNSDKYKPLTNSNLLYLRAYLPEYSYNNDVLNTVSNGIGIDKVDKMIRERLTSLGTSTSIRSGYSVKSDSYIALGLNVLSQIESAAVAGLTGMTLDGMYKNKIITKDLKQQAEAALQYIYNTLPDNAKTLLSIKSGNASNPKAGAIEVIQLLITSRMNQTNSSETTWEGTLEQVTKSKSSGDSDSSNEGTEGVKTGPYSNMAAMIGGTPGHITLNKGSKNLLDVDGVNYSITDSDGKQIGKTSLENLLVSGFLGIVTDKSAITFGDVLLSDTDFDNIMYDSMGGTVAILPVTTVDGKKVVDINVLDRWEEANNELQELGITSVYDPNNLQKIREILYKHELDKCVDVVTGNVDYSAFRPFMIIDGYAVDHNDRFNSEYVHEIEGDDETIAMIEKGLSTNSDQDNYKIDLDDWLDFNGYDRVYRGSIYIPITSNKLQAMTAEGNKLKEQSGYAKEYEYLMLEKRLSAKKAGLL